MKKGIQISATLLALIIYIFSSCNQSKKGATVEAQTNAGPHKVIILAIDGGGIKGIIPAFILDSIEENLGSQCYQLFDIIGGTSTGGIISTGLVSKDDSTGQPYSAAKILGLYLNGGHKIFVPQPNDSSDAAKYYANLNQTNGIEPLLQQMMGDTTSLSGNHSFIQNLTPRVKQVFTTCYIVNSNGAVVTNPVKGKDYGPYLFNWYDADNTTGNNYYMWEAARGTSAAPTYFPIAQVGDSTGASPSRPEKWVVDGGVMSNNPAIWAISEAFRTGIATSLRDIVVISIGTGTYVGEAGVGINNNTQYNLLYPDVPANGNWGVVDWAVEQNMYDLLGVADSSSGLILSIIENAVQFVPNQQILGMQNAGLQYYRLQPFIGKGQSQMDSISQANNTALLDTVRNYITTGAGAATFNTILDSLKSW